MCCSEVFNSDFVDAHPELTARLVLANVLSDKYMYEHPYSAALMFAKDFGVSQAAGLRTIYLKTNAEGRTLNWDISVQNYENMIAYQEYWGIPESSQTRITNGDPAGMFDLSFFEALEIESFDEYAESVGLDEKFPIGMTYTEWLYAAETIDGIDHNSTVGKNVEKWMNDEIMDVLPLTKDEAAS